MSKRYVVTLVIETQDDDWSTSGLVDALDSSALTLRNRSWVFDAGLVRVEEGSK